MKENISHSFSYKKLRFSICCIFKGKYVFNKLLCNGQLYQTSSTSCYYEPCNKLENKPFKLGQQWQP